MDALTLESPVLGQYSMSFVRGMLHDGASIQRF